MRIEMKILNLSEVQRSIEDLPRKIGTKVLERALKAGGKVYEEKLKAATPVKTGTLQKSIKLTVRRPGSGGYLGSSERAVEIGIFKWYARLVEYGHKWTVKTRSNADGKLRVVAEGTKGPNPFMRNSFDSNEGEIQTAIARELSIGISSEVKTS